MSHSLKKYGRRAFIGTMSCAAVGSTTFFSTLFNLQSMNAASLVNKPEFGANEDYRALVCIMLGGGNDSYNMVIPTSSEHHQVYSQTRSNQAIPRDQVLPLNAKTYQSQELGFHPSMPELKALFDQEKLAVLCNVGTLVEPIKKSDFYRGQKLPFGLFSHADQDKQWQTSVPQTNAATGWAGRLADMVQAANTNQEISMNISLSGKNIFQLGEQVSEYSILPTGTGSRGIKGYGGSQTFDQIRTAAVQSLMEQQYQDIFKKTYAETIQASQNTHALFSQAIAGSSLQTTFSASDFSQRLRMVARTMQVRQQLGVRRQTFFVRFDGWDHHDELLNNHSQMLGILSKGMSEFQAALAELGLEDAVTTFTISDFARTLTSNGNGTDHAWGGNVLVMGKQVRGKDIYGLYPRLELNGELEVGNGILIPQISTDEYFAELALWYGVSPTELPILFPNIGNFYNTFSNNPPLGFLPV